MLASKCVAKIATHNLCFFPKALYTPIASSLVYARVVISQLCVGHQCAASVTRRQSITGLALSHSKRALPPPHQQKNNISAIVSVREQLSGPYNTASTGQYNHLRLLGLVLVSCWCQ